MGTDKLTDLQPALPAPKPETPQPGDYDRPTLAKRSDELFGQIMKVFVSPDYKFQHQRSNSPDFWGGNGVVLSLESGDWKLKIDPKKPVFELELDAKDPENSKSTQVSHFPNRDNNPNSVIRSSYIEVVPTGDGKRMLVERWHNNNQEADNESEKLIQAFAKDLQNRSPLSSVTPKLNG